MSDVLVLCYHAVSEDWSADLSITPDALERQLRWLVGRGYVGAAFTEAVTAPPAPRTVAVTFDDAYRSTLTHAAPVLARVGLPGTVYAPTGWVGADRPMTWPGIEQWLGGPHEHELLPLGWDGLRELAEAGWEVGSHTCSHPHLTQCDDATLARELAESRAACEAGMGLPCPSIAYPYGDCDERVRRAAAAAGYTTGAGLPTTPRDQGALEFPRIGIYLGDAPWRFRLKASRVVRWIRGR